jgi:3-oxoacyl-[acyl-carrier-protein] synthase II
MSIVPQGAAYSGVVIQRHRFIHNVYNLIQVVGYGLSGDAYNSTAPCEDGDGALRSMRMALQDAGVQPSEVRVCCLW